MKQHKFIVFLILFFIFSFKIFSADGRLWGEKYIRVIQTEWFDIIYPPESQESAALLYENVDRIYLEVANFFGRLSVVRMTVVLCPKTEMYNAYFSYAFSNHIVLYDTAAIDMEVFSNDLLSTFRHEVTHAYTYNMKNKFWQAVDKIFGDVLNPGALFINSGWAESATLLSESSQGEGRLNDEYSKQMVKQAKIENMFPEYSDVRGSSDVYPRGSFYNFGGAFAEWLKEKYGMKKYSAFWYKCINFQTISTKGAFKSVYGLKVDEAWHKFMEDVKVPAVKSNPLDEDDLLISDFFSGSENEYSIKNENGALYSNVTASENSVAFLDEKSGSIWISKKDDFGNLKKPRKLFSVSEAQTISLSRDGRFLAVSYYDTKTPTELLRVKIYDMKKKVWKNLKGSGIANATIVQNGNENFVVSLSFVSQSKKINIQNLENSKNQIDIQMEANVMPSEFIDIGGGKFAFIKRTGLSRELCIATVNGEIIFEKSLPANRMVIKNLSYDFTENKIYFSYTLPGTMPRLGVYVIDEDKFMLAEKDLSGGIYCPVKINDDKFIYVGNFYRQNRIFYLSAKNLFEPENDTPSIINLCENLPVENIVRLNKSAEEILSDSKKYNPFKFLTKGLFLPASMVSSYSYDLRDEENYGKSEMLPIGVTYMTANPWDSNIFISSIGYSPTTNSVGILFSATGGTSTSIFNWQTQTQTEFDFAGWKQASNVATLSSTIPFGKISKFVFSDTLNVFVGRGNDSLFDKNYLFGVRLFPTTTKQRNIFLGINELSVYYSCVHKTGPGLYESGGITIGSNFTYGKFFDLEYYKFMSLTSLEISPFMQIRIPKLIPIDCKNFFTYNFPATLAISFFTGSTTFTKISANTVLFSFDIQKAVPVLSAIYVNRFTFTTGYETRFLRESDNLGILRFPSFVQDFVHGKLLYNDYIHLCTTIELTPNFGTFANPNLKFGFNFDVLYYFHPSAKAKTPWDFNFSVSGLLVL